MRMIGEPDAAVDRPVTAFASSLPYGGLVYGKGAYLYRAIRKIVGDEAFFAGLHDYVSQNRFRVAEPDALITLLARGAHAAEVQAAAHRYLFETHGDDDLGPVDASSVLADALGPQASSLGGSSLGPMLEQIMKMIGPRSGRSL
jgi:hypothetical protein